MAVLFKGFSLLELLVSLMLISILIAIAYPSYQHYLQRMHRQQAVLILMQLSDALTRYHFYHHTYEGATLVDLSVVVNSNFYKIILGQQTQNTYELSATPLFSDKQCGVLILNELHERKTLGGGSIDMCW